MPDGGTPVLPAVPAEGAALAAVIGAEGLLRLVEARGGTNVQLGERAMPSQKLQEKLGLTAPELQRLRKAFGKSRIKVPLCKRWRARIYRARGLSYSDIALKLNTSETSVHKWLQDAGLTRQFSLNL